MICSSSASNLRRLLCMIAHTVPTASPLTKKGTTRHSSAAGNIDGREGSPPAHFRNSAYHCDQAHLRSGRNRVGALQSTSRPTSLRQQANRAVSLDRPLLSCRERMTRTARPPKSSRRVSEEYWTTRLPLHRLVSSTHGFPFCSPAGVTGDDGVPPCKGSSPVEQRRWKRKFDGGATFGSVGHFRPPRARWRAFIGSPAAPRSGKCQ